MKILALYIGEHNTMCWLYDSTTQQTVFRTTDTTLRHLRKIFAENRPRRRAQAG